MRVFAEFNGKTLFSFAKAAELASKVAVPFSILTSNA